MKKLFILLISFAIFVVAAMVTISHTYSAGDNLLMENAAALADDPFWYGLDCNPNTFGYKEWNLSGVVKKEFYDCCTVLRQGFAPKGACQ